MLLRSLSGFAAGTVITVMGFGLLVAQTFNASVQGVVSDQTGAVVPNAAITLVNEQTNVRQNANSDQVGRYRLLNLPPGVYRVSVEVMGFQTFIRTGMEMQVNQNVGLDVVLTPGDVNSSVTVTGEAPRLDTQDASLGRVVDNKSLLNMPLTTRDPLGLVTLAPGISGSAGANTGTNFSANGGRNSQADVLIDGMSITMPEGGISIVEYRPSVEAIQEFKVQTNSFSAEFGNSGTAVVNMVMRSGGNQVHGSVFEFLRNSDMNSNAFFSNRAGKPLASFQRNTFGGAVGGPVVLPHLYHGKDRTFFFVNFEEGIQSAPITQLDTVPTLDQRNGDFSKSVNAQGQLIAIYNPYSGGRDASGNWIRAPFPNNVIPKSLFNTVGANMVGYYALPNTASTSLANTNNHFGSGAKHQTDRQLNAKVDHSFNDRNRLSVRYGLYTDIYTNDNLWATR